MRKSIACITVLAALCSIPIYGQVHVAEPAVNLGDTSFLDALGGPGGIVEQIGDGTHDGRIANAVGSTVPNSGSVNSVSGLTHIAWLSHKQVLGGWYGTEVVIAAAHVNAGAQGEAGGFGNFTVSPFILQWPEKRGRGRFRSACWAVFTNVRCQYQQPCLHRSSLLRNYCLSGKTDRNELPCPLSLELHQ